MRILYYHCLSPFARKAQVVLHEKGLHFETVVVRDWERPEEFLALNPAGEVPVLVDDDYVICGATAICEYVDECYPAPPLLSHDPVLRAEVRRLVDWFDHKFFQEVTVPTAGEKLTKRVLTGDAPDSRLIRAGRANIHTHLQYIAWLSERRRWLAGETLSLGRPDGGGASVVGGLCGRCTVGRARAGQGLVCPCQVPPQFPLPAGGDRARCARTPSLRRSGLLGKKVLDTGVQVR